MDLLTKTISPFFTRRLREIETFAKRPADIQQKQLRSLLDKARNTLWGKKYMFTEISDYATFRERIPVHSYEELQPFIERMINGEKDVLWPSRVGWYAKSSGTTNDRSKYIPVTTDILRKCHYAGAFDTVACYLYHHPESRFFSKKGLILGGSHSPSPLNKHSHCGDLSAVLLQKLNPLVNLMRVPRKEIILMDEWEKKIEAIVESTWREDVVSLSGVPSWMLVLIKAVLKRAGKETLAEVWPNLEVFFHGGIGFDPYRTQYEKIISSDKMSYMETYNASEGFFGLQDDPSDKSMLLMLDYGVFYEFIPQSGSGSSDNAAIPLEEVKTGENYAMVITTAGGLWRYNLGDTVRFTSLFPHKFVITGRTKLFINAFGEELMVDNAEKGIRRACQQTGAVVRAYTAAPLFLLDKAKGRHQWMVEFETPPSSVSTFATILDNALQELNSDYEAKRYKEISLQPLEVLVARENLFYDWLKRRGKLGGQHKVPCLSNNRLIMEELLRFNNER